MPGFWNAMTAAVGPPVQMFSVSDCQYYIHYAIKGVDE